MDIVTTTSITTTLPSSQDDAIRARLLNRLGIYQKVPTPLRPLPKVQRQVSEEDSSKRQKVMRTIGAYETSPRRASLKSPSAVTTPTTTTTTTTTTTSNNNNNTVSFQAPLNHGPKSRVPLKSPMKLRFNDQITVVTIPSHRQYSDRIKRFMWSSGLEIHENAERNIREFEFEGWDFQTVLDEDHMYMDARTGELIHPCWIEEMQANLQPDSDDEQDMVDASAGMGLTKSPTMVGFDEANLVVSR